MSAFLRLLRRDLVEQHLLPAMGLVLGLILMALPWLGDALDFPGKDLQPVMARTAATAYAGILGLMLGATTLSQEQENRRLAFYLSRPLPGPALIWGRLLSNALILSLCAALVLLPNVSALRDINLGWGQLLRELGWSTLLSVDLMLLASATVLALRSGTRLGLLDLVMLVGLLAALYFIQKLLLEPYFGVRSEFPRTPDGHFASTAFLTWLPALYFPSLLLAHLLQVRRGRMDLNRAHRGQSLGLAAGILSVYGMCLLATELQINTVSEQFFLGVRGDWVELDQSIGTRWGLKGSARLLLNHRDGRRLRFPHYYIRALQGNCIAWATGQDPLNGSHTLHWMGLKPGQGRRHAIDLPEEIQGLRFSPSGKHILARTTGELLIIDLDSARVLNRHAMPHPIRYPFSPLFEDETQVLIPLTSKNQDVRMVAWNWMTGQEQGRGTLQGEFDFGYWDYWNDRGYGNRARTHNNFIFARKVAEGWKVEIRRPDLSLERSLEASFKQKPRAMWIRNCYGVTFEQQGRIWVQLWKLDGTPKPLIDIGPLTRSGYSVAYYGQSPSSGEPFIEFDKYFRLEGNRLSAPISRKEATEGWDQLPQRIEEPNGQITLVGYKERNLVIAEPGKPERVLLPAPKGGAR